MQRSNPTRRLWCALLLIIAGSMVLAGLHAANSPSVLVLRVEGAIGPATTDYLVRGLTQAEQSQATLVVIEIDTPGGLEAATRDIDKSILNSAVPVAVYVSPSGARAASAGTYILYASHLAAMAPGTNLGAATPVALGGGGSATPPSRARPESGSDSGESDESSDNSAQGAGDSPPAQATTAMERKVINDAVATLRSMAELRGRNADWAEAAVREGASLTANAALEQGVIEIIAVDLADLLEQAEGREVLVNGESRALALQGASIERLEPNWRQTLLSLITNPSVAYLLLLVGVYGLLLEGYNPGTLIPGLTGLVCLLLAAYALQVLPVNYVGLALLLLGILLMLGEVLSPSFGVLGISGAIALVSGSILLFDSDLPGYQVPRALLAGVGVVSAAAMMLLAQFLARSRRQASIAGGEGLLLEEAVALESFSQFGQVRAHGEIWAADSSSPVTAGQRLHIDSVDGLRLKVRPASQVTNSTQR